MRWRLLKLNWSYGIGELVIVVAGVLIALGLDSWNSDRLDRELEAEYLSRLATDLESHYSADQTIIRLLEVKLDRLNEIAALLEQPEDDTSVGRLADALRSGALNLGFALPEYTAATFDELISTGRIDLIRDVDLRTRLSVYENSRRQFLARIAGRQTSFPALAYGMLPPDVYYAPDGESVTLDRQTREILSQALTDLDFRQRLNAERNYAQFVSGLIRQIQEAVEANLQALRNASES